MQFLPLLLVLGLVLVFPSFSSCGTARTSDVCPMDFDFLRDLINHSSLPINFLDVPTECGYMLQALRLVRSLYLRSTGHFFPPLDSSEACWEEYQRIIDGVIPGVDIRSSCGFNNSLMSGTCANVVTKSDFEGLVSNSEMIRLNRSCNQLLENHTACQSCTESLSVIQELHFAGSNGSDCSGYPFVYAAVFANQFGPSDKGNLMCLFTLDFSPSSGVRRKHGAVYWGTVAGCTFGSITAALITWFCWARHWWKKKRKKSSVIEMKSGNAPVLEGGTASLVMSMNSQTLRFGIEEIKNATDNFSRWNIIGKGGYGYVYRGVLADGSEVAVKRFKNCNAVAAVDEIFAHEVKVIASVRQVNLVTLRGYCTVADPMGGCQRIIVCDLIHNGDLSDHLFGSREPLDWSARWKIAVGTARGLAYLHQGVQPAIIHRDIKASNILLDKNHEPKLADFGLAKFKAEGVSHLSTRVAGTLGYVAPEYALYGQVSESCDVYSYGVVLLEILSGKKAAIFGDAGKTTLLADWAWTLVRENKAIDIVDETITGLDDRATMERYVLLAVLCAHPLAQARPAADQIVTILETNSPLPSIPDRPASLFLAETADRKACLSSMAGSSRLLRTAGLIHSGLKIQIEEGTHIISLQSKLG